MFLQGGPPCRYEASSGVETMCNTVMCPVCGVVWGMSSIESIFSESEKERFWSGQGCPDCRICRSPGEQVF